jgi:hypothetical protein
VNRGCSRLADVLEDTTDDWTSKSAPVGSVASSSDISRRTPNENSIPSSVLKLHVVKRLWQVLAELLPDHLSEDAHKLAACLMKHEDELTESGSEAQEAWVGLVSELLLLCEPEAQRAFWGHHAYDDVSRWRWIWTDQKRSKIWTSFSEHWLDSQQSTYEGILILLQVPFS